MIYCSTCGYNGTVESGIGSKPGVEEPVVAVVETGTESQDVDSKEEGGEKSSEESSQPDTEAGPDTAASESLVA